jgi:hypothetical protein
VLTHVPRAELHDRLQQLTRERVQRVVSVVPDPDDPDCYIVHSESFEIETRNEA